MTHMQHIRNEVGFLRGVQTLEIHRLLEEGIRSGEVVPLPLNVFDRADVSSAFRFMAAGAAFLC